MLLGAFGNFECSPPGEVEVCPFLVKIPFQEVAIGSSVSVTSHRSSQTINRLRSAAVKRWGCERTVPKFHRAL
jgi:hypothetical protein